jgi:hypothetical protein
VTGPRATTARVRQHGHIRSRVSGRRNGTAGDTGGLPRAQFRPYRPRELVALADSGVMGTRSGPGGRAARWVPMVGPDGRRRF